MGRARLVAVFAVIAIGCGNGASDGDAGDGIDAAGTDGGVCMPTWELTSVPITAITLMDPGTIHTERLARFVVTTEMAGSCVTRAMPSIVWQPQNRVVFVEMRAWHSLGGDCTDSLDIVPRPIDLRFPVADMWTVSPGPPGSSGDSAMVDVQGPPSAMCGDNGPFDCEMDCDCAFGEACLGGSGLGGPFTQCARPCELDRDCAGNGRCVSADDGLDFYCDEFLDECDDMTVCPTGYVCENNACEPDFLLDTATRSSCECDDDCAPPLRCIEPSEPGRARHCELACPTGSAAWCSVMHYCGPADEDVAGTAPADSVCIWLGE